jgi:hypothetical protein
MKLSLVPTFIHASASEKPSFARKESDGDKFKKIMPRCPLTGKLRCNPGDMQIKGS